jgi:PAS domain S-box-containing protein
VDELRREKLALQLRIAELEQALRDAEEVQHARARAITIVEASSAAIFSTAVDGTLLCWNAAAAKLYGFSIGAAIGRNALELVPFDRLDEHMTAVRRAIAGEHVLLDTTRRRADGSTVAVRVIYARLADEHGKLLGVGTHAHAR